MRKIRHNSTRRTRWLISLASVVLLAGCSGPYAWTRYIDPSYALGTNAIEAAANVPAQVGGTVDGIPQGELSSIVAQGIEAPTVAPARGAATALQGSGAPADPPTRTVWMFSSAAAPGGGTNVHVEATYYRDNAIFSIAEGDATIAGGNDPQLRQLVANVSAALVPRIRHGGSGRG